MKSRFSLALAVLLGLSGGTQGNAAETARKPNFLVILADDMGFSDAGCYGGEIETPNLDRLAASGLRFTQFYNTARCWPSRACILTGYYAQQVRMDPQNGRLPRWTRLLPHYLKPAGYRCYHSGKWHVSGAPRILVDGGFDRGFRIDDQDRHFNPQTLAENGQVLPPVVPDSGFYDARAIADHAIAYLKEHVRDHPDRPFFQYLAFTTPHFPLHALPEDLARYRDRYVDGWDIFRERRWKKQRTLGIVNCALSPREPRTVPSWNLTPQEIKQQVGPMESAYGVPWNELSDIQKKFQSVKMAIHAAMVDRIDREIGRVLDQLKAMEALDDTVIFFASDNGASAEEMIRGDGHDPLAPPGSAKSFLCLGPGWSTTANTPFRKHKSWVHEGGIATPLIVQWTRGISERGNLRRDPGHLIDIVPTVLDLAGVQPSTIWNGVTAPRLAGRSLVPQFAHDGAGAHEPLFFSHEGHRALRVGDWKLVSSRENSDTWELYNLANDRSEIIDLASKQPNRVRSMAAQWQNLDTTFRREAAAE